MKRCEQILFATLLMCLSLWASDEGKCGELTAKLRGEVEEVARMVVEHARVAAIPDQRVMADLLSSEIDEKTSAIVRSGLPFPELEVHLRKAVEGMQEEYPLSTESNKVLPSAGERLEEEQKNRWRSEAQATIDHIESELLNAPLEELGKTLEKIRNIPNVGVLLNVAKNPRSYGLAATDFKLSEDMNLLMENSKLDYRIVDSMSNNSFGAKSDDTGLLVSLANVPTRLADRLFLANLQLHPVLRHRILSANDSTLFVVIHQQRNELLEDLLKLKIPFHRLHSEAAFNHNQRAFGIFAAYNEDPVFTEGKLLEAIDEDNLSLLENMKAAGFSFQGRELMKTSRNRVIDLAVESSLQAFEKRTLFGKFAHMTASIFGWVQVDGKWGWWFVFRPSVPGVFETFKGSPTLEPARKVYEFLVREGAQ